MLPYTIEPLGDEALIIRFGHLFTEDNFQNIITLVHILQNETHEAIIDIVPAYTTVTIHYVPFKIKDPLPYETMCTFLKTKLDQFSENIKLSSNRVNIPICYDESVALDLYSLAKYHHLSIEKVIRLHTSVTYRVMFIGFSPGFPFLHGLDKQLATPRKTSPRALVPAGSVGIAGQQTGIYPTSTPGGWQIIGKTPITLFSINNTSKPSLLLPGDTVTFFPITYEELLEMEERT